MNNISLREVINILREKYEELKLIEEDINSNLDIISSSKEYDKGKVVIDFYVPNYLYMDVELNGNKERLYHKLYREYILTLNNTFKGKKTDTYLECHLKKNKIGHYEWNGTKRKFKLYVRNQNYLDGKIMEIDKLYRELRNDFTCDNYSSDSFDYYGKVNEISIINPKCPYFCFYYKEHKYMTRYNFGSDSFDYFDELVYKDKLEEKIDINKLVDNIYYDKKYLPYYAKESIKKIKKVNTNNK